MPTHRILQLNAVSTAVCAVALLACRGPLSALFGAPGPRVFDAIAVAFLAYAGALALAARRRPVPRLALVGFAAADAGWVVGSVVLLALLWSELAPIARLLVIVVAAAVEAFAWLQFRAARSAAA